MDEVARHDHEQAERDHAPVPAVEVAVVGLEERRDGQRDHGHELDEDVERRPRRVLEGVADRVADDARVVMSFLPWVLERAARATAVSVDGVGSSPRRAQVELPKDAAADPSSFFSFDRPFVPSFSQYFLALSQAPPALLIIMATMAPLTMAPPNTPTSVAGPTRNPTNNGARTAYVPGAIISRTEDLVEISTHLLLSGITSFSGGMASPFEAMTCVGVALMASRA